MAKIELSGIGITAMSGRLGNNVIARNHYGYYERANITTTEEDTPYQDAQQAKMVAVLAQWPLLDESERIAWDAAASSGQWWVGTKLSGKHKPTGQNLFVRVNLSAYDYSFPITSPPAKRIFPFDQLPAVTAAEPTPPDGLNIVLSTDTIPTLTSCQIWVTEAGSTGIMRPQWSLFKLLYSAPYDTYSDEMEVGTEYVTRHGSMASGKKLFVETRLIDWTTGVIIPCARVSAFT